MRALAGGSLATALVALRSSLLAGCGDDDAGDGDAARHPVDPPFTVSTQDRSSTPTATPYSLAADTDKRLTLVFFGYTNCPDICGLVMGNLASAMTRLDEHDRDQVEVVFVTTDPDRDTADVLRATSTATTRASSASPAPIDEIAAVGKSIAVGMGEELPTGGYEVDAHTTQVTAIDSDDEAPIYWSHTTSSAQFAQDIHTLLGED